MNQELIERVRSVYFEKFDVEPKLVVRAPGRINVIGEHTDYNDGWVLPGSIDRAIYIAIGVSEDKCSKVYSIDLEDSIEFINTDLKRSEKGWANYILGVVDQLRNNEYQVGPFQACFAGDIPIGSGLSSSAALECGFGFGLSQIFVLGLSKVQVATFGQAAEHSFVGVKCGIMDQFASVFGERDQVLLLDCRTLDYDLHPVVLEQYQFVLINSMVHHSLASSEYNNRREECEEAVKALQNVRTDILSLRDATISDLGKIQGTVSETVYRRAKYVIKENARVLQMTAAMKEGETNRIGELLNATHHGLRTEYEVSCPEIDFLVDLVKHEPAVLGSRIMGGGFGGCTLNLMKSSEADGVVKQVINQYESKFGLIAESYSVKLTEGVSKVS